MSCTDWSFGGLINKAGIFCSNFEAMLVFAECCIPVIRALDFLEREIKISGSRVSVWMWLD